MLRLVFLYILGAHDMRLPVHIMTSSAFTTQVYKKHQQNRFGARAYLTLFYRNKVSKDAGYSKDLRYCCTNVGSAIGYLLFVQF